MTPASTTTKPATVTRHALLLTVAFPLFAVLLVPTLLGGLLNLGGGGVSDWIAYWSSANLLVHHQNPYDGVRLASMEKQFGIDSGKYPPLTRNPPSALWMIAPLGVLSPRAAGLYWRLLLVAVLVFSVRLWQRLSGRVVSRWNWIAYFATPAVACIEVGQTTLLTLPGLAACLLLLNRAPFLAGAAFAICAIKPHLFLPFGAVLLCWIAKERDWRFLAGAIVSFTLQALAPLSADPSVWQHYIAAMRTNGIAQQLLPTPAAALRFAIRPTALWLQFLPAVLACCWSIWYFLRRRDQWNWPNEAPLLLLVSLMVAPYAWTGVDSVLVLPAVVLLVPRCSEKAVAVVLLLFCAVMVQFALKLGMSSPILLWESPAWLAWYLYARRTATPEALAAA